MPSIPPARTELSSYWEKLPTKSPAECKTDAKGSASGTAIGPMREVLVVSLGRCGEQHRFLGGFAVQAHTGQHLQRLRERPEDTAMQASRFHIEPGRLGNTADATQPWQFRAMTRSTIARAVLLAASSVLAWPAVAQSLALAQAIELPSVNGRIDHMDIDVDGSRLFVAALGAGSVEVVDLQAGKRIARIRPLHGPQGVVYLPGMRRLVVANGGSGDVQAFAEGKAPAVATAGGLDDADNIRVDRATGELYIGHAHALAAVDSTTLRLGTRIVLAGHPEAFELESGGPRVYVNVPSAGHIAVIDRSSGKVIATWGLGGASRNFPMALDEAAHRLFVATRQPPLMLVYDTTTGKRTASLPVCGDADDLFHDGPHQQLYAICGEGAIDVIRQRDPDHYEVARQVQTSRGARTGLFVPRLSTLFVAVPATGGSAAEIRAYKVE